MQRSVLLRITSTNNAIVDPYASTALLSIDPDVPQFSYRPNAVAYPGMNATNVHVDIILESGRITQPSTLKYRLYEMTVPEQPFLLADASSGFLTVESGAGGVEANGVVVGTIAVPIQWSAVPDDAQYRIGMELSGFFNAWTVGRRGASDDDTVAVHVFGVGPGTCPRGSAATATATSLSSEKNKTREPVAIGGSNSGNGSREGNGGASSSSSVKVGPATTVQLMINNESTIVPLSTRSSGGGGSRSDTSSSSSLDVGAMVASNVTVATLIFVGSPRTMINVVSVNVDEGALPIPPSLVNGKTVFELHLIPGTNQFNLSTMLAASDGDAGDGGGSNTDGLVVLSIVRLADETHARLLSIEAKGLDGAVVIVCGPPSSTAFVGSTTTNVLLPGSGVGYSSSASTTSTSTSMDGNDGVSSSAPVVELKSSSPSSSSPHPTAPTPTRKEKTSSETLAEMVTLSAWKQCIPNAPMEVTIPASTDTLSLTPTLLHPEIPNVRVEVNGQVLSRGGDVGADQQADTGGAFTQTSPTTTTTTTTTSSTQLPAAFIMGMQPGLAVDVEVIVVAEDGVTSARYPVSISRALSVDNSNVTYYGATTATHPGWPTPPALTHPCDVCPPGWMSGTINAPSCSMCPPGTASTFSGSSQCSSCSPGTFSMPWGSTHCKHCIAGTYAPHVSATACRMCPDGTTTGEDGQSQCNVTLGPATDLELRYAVVIYFSVNVTGSDPEDIVLKAGVNAPAETIVSNLLRSDTAAAFNISVQDVQVLSVHRVARRILQANVSATLGVDVPGNATEEDIATALEVQKLSADRPIELLSQNPDLFFGRTTRTLDVGVHANGDDVEKIENRPSNSFWSRLSRWLMFGFGGVMGMVGVVLVVVVTVGEGSGGGGGGRRRHGHATAMSGFIRRWKQQHKLSFNRYYSLWRDSSSGGSGDGHSHRGNGGQAAVVV